MENQEVQHLEINIPEWLANSNDQIVIICSDQDGAEFQTGEQQDMVTVPLNTILDETEQSQVVVQMPAETLQTPSTSEVPVPSSSEVPKPRKAEVRMAVIPVDKPELPPSQSLAEDKPDLSPPQSKSDKATTDLVSAEDDHAQLTTVQVMIKKIDSNENEEIVTPVALFKRMDNSEEVAEEAGVSADEESGTEDQSSSKGNSNLKEHDYLAVKQSEPNQVEDKQPKPKKAPAPPPVSRRSKRKAAMSPRRWCRAGRCDDGCIIHGKSKEVKATTEGKEEPTRDKEEPTRDKEEPTQTKRAATPAKSAATEAKSAARPAKCTSTPTKNATTPTKRAATPAKSAATPAKSAPTPAERAATPAKSTPTPDERAATADKSAPMPAKRAATATKSAPMPAKRAPAKRAATADKTAPTPAKRAAVPAKKAAITGQKIESTGRKAAPKRAKVVMEKQKDGKKSDKESTSVELTVKIVDNIEEIDTLENDSSEHGEEASSIVSESEIVDPANEKSNEQVFNDKLKLWEKAKARVTWRETKKLKKLTVKNEQDSFTVSPDGIDPNEVVPINIIKATKPEDLKSLDTEQLGGSINTDFECICGQKFTQKRSLIRHFRRKKARPDGIEESGSEHYSKYPIAIYPNTKAPRKKKPGPKIFPCPYCPKELQTKAGMDYHVMSHTGHKPVLCSLCGEAFKSKQLLDQHFVIHTDSSELPCKCDDCGRTYLTATRLRAHKKTHGERIWHCEFCPHKFVMSKDLKKHMRIHTGETPFHCDFCGEQFHFSQDVKRHLKKSHIDKAPFKCPVCPKKNVFFKQEEFDMHMRIHGNSEYHCEICTQNFPSYTTFRNHQVMHSGRNPFTCRYDNCGQEFKNANDRYLHERKVHDTNLLFCPFCNISFKKQSAYEEHIKKHRESSFQCRADPECGMTFSQPYARLRHEKSHKTGGQVNKSDEIKKQMPKRKIGPPPKLVSPKPSTVYQCGVCWKTYKNYPSLRDHVREHGEDMNYKCRVAGCDMRFKRVYHRRKHEQSHSTDEIINSVLDSRLRADEESIDSSGEEGAMEDEGAVGNGKVGCLSAELAAQALAASAASELVLLHNSEARIDSELVMASTASELVMANTASEVVVTSTDAEPADFEETEIAVQFVLH